MQRKALGSCGGMFMLAVLLVVAASAGPADGAMIVSGGQVLTSGGVSAVGTPSFEVIGGGGNADDPFKLSGGGSFVSDGTAGEIIFRTTGLIQFILDEDWNIAWDFTTDYQSGDATWRIVWDSDCPIFGKIDVETPKIPIPSGQEHYDGDFSFTNYFIWTSQQPFTTDIVLAWDGSAGDTFTVTIPDNSIDFSVGTVPEPAVMSLLAVGGLVLLRRRR